MYKTPGVHRVGTAVLPVERLYVLSLGRRQGNAHVHWHVVPLPPGVPYREQQLGLSDLTRPRAPAGPPAALATELHRRLA